MRHPSRDHSVLRHIISYCDQIDETVAHFGEGYERFVGSAVYRNAVALCILQIGELVGKLTDEFKEQYPDIPWKQIKAMRNIVAHSYGTVDPETTWEIVNEDIPALRKFCEEILAS